MKLIPFHREMVRVKGAVLETGGLKGNEIEQVEINQHADDSPRKLRGHIWKWHDLPSMHRRELLSGVSIAEREDARRASIEVGVHRLLVSGQRGVVALARIDLTIMNEKRLRGRDDWTTQVVGKFNDLDWFPNLSMF